MVEVVRNIHTGSKMKKARKNNNKKKKPFQIGGLDMWNDIIWEHIALDIELLKLNFKCKQEVFSYILHNIKGGKMLLRWANKFLLDEKEN